MRAVLLLLVACGSTCLVTRAADGPSGRVTRSHIQPVGELAADRDAAWSGLVTVRASAVLREQFRLERGAGLVIEEVAAGSAAELVGLKRHDLLVSLDGQLLILPDQFTTLLEASGPDAPLECRLIRSGVEKTVSLQRVSAEVRPAAGILKPTQSAINLVPRTPPASIATVTQLPGGTFQQRDSDYVVKLSGGAEPRLVVKDVRGRIIFNGPIDTPEQRSLVPPEVRGRVEGLERLVAQQEAVRKATEGSAERRPTTARIGSLDIAPVEIR